MWKTRLDPKGEDGVQFATNLPGKPLEQFANWFSGFRRSFPRAKVFGVQAPAHQPWKRSIGLFFIDSLSRFMNGVPLKA